MTRRFPLLTQTLEGPAEIIPLVEFLRRRLAIAILAEDRPTCIRLTKLIDQLING